MVEYTEGFGRSRLVLYNDSFSLKYIRYLFHREAANLGLVFLFLPDTHDHEVQPFPNKIRYSYVCW